MPYCAVPECKHGTGSRNINPPGTRYHTLPKNQEVAKKWWQLIRRDEEMDLVKDVRVCSAHFRDEDYLASSQGECSRSLRKGALPSLSIPSSQPSSYVMFSLYWAPFIIVVSAHNKDVPIKLICTFLCANSITMSYPVPSCCTNWKLCFIEWF